MTNGNPVAYGERLLPQVVDEYARVDPDRVYASYATSTDLSRGFRNVTMKDIASAVNAFAWWMKDRLGMSDNFDTVAYMGASDLRYPICCLAGMKCGWKILLLGPRNSVAQNHNLLERTQCTKLLYSVEMTRTVEALQRQEVDLAMIEIQSLDDILLQKSQPFPFEKTFAEAASDPALIIHSSGSTGSPKLITMTHGTFSVTDNDRNMPTPEGRHPQNGAQFNFEGRFFSCFPPYHLAGVQAFLILPSFSTGATIVLGPPSIPPSGYMMGEVIRQQKEKLKAFYVPPSIIEQWVRDHNGLEQARQLDFVLYGGGPLSPTTGDLLSQVTDVCQMYGSAETGQIQLLVPQKGEWAYMEWNPAEEVDMQPSSEGAYELVLHQDPKFSKRRSLQHNFPDIKEWRSRDLFVPHPSKPGLWRFYARLDDLILLSNSHKLNPVAIESLLLGHPSLAGALVVGTGRFQPALLLELRSNLPLSERDRAIEDIWPTIQQANLLVPGYAQITHPKVALSDPSKPFIRASKGTVIRKLTINAYAAEIESLYLESATDYNGPILDDLSLIGTTQFIKDAVALLVPEAEFDNNNDFFSLGLDSLKVAELVNILKSALIHHEDLDQSQLSTRLIYEYPTVSQLARVLHTALFPVENSELGPEYKALMGDLVEKYTHSLPSVICINTKNTVEPRENLHIVLTGSTGSLGSNILETLLHNPRVTKVSCLNRSLEKTQKQKKLFANGEPSHFINSTQTSFIQVDFSKLRMDLPDETYTSLLATADIIIHAAWTVNFNLALSSYEASHLNGLRSLIDFSILSTRNPRLVFTSSTAYALDWAATYASGTIPAAILTPSDDVPSTGYGKSKQVAERVLARASEACNIAVTILRIGQIAGSTSADSGRVWSKSEWIPALMETSNRLNLIPTADFAIDWIPVEDLARVVMDIILKPNDSASADDSRLQVYNLVNPRLTPWATFAGALQQRLPSARTVSLQEWVQALARYNTNSLTNLQNLPALKILPFFQALAQRTRAEAGKSQPRITTETAVQASKTMAELQSVGEAWLEELV